METTVMGFVASHVFWGCGVWESAGEQESRSKEAMYIAGG